jgi:hypothetical protein
MVDLLQETTSGFKTSLNPRVDGELCLIHLCQPDLTLDAKDLAARVSRVEEDVTDKLAQLEQKLKSGNFVVSQTAPEPADLDAPPPWEDDDAPPLPEEPEPQAETPQDGDWLKIRERALPELDPMVRPFLSQLDGRIRGDDLTLTPLNSTIRGMVNRPEVLELLRKKAAVVLGRPMRVHLGEPNGRGIGGPDRLQALADQFGNLDNFTIKK